MPSNLGWSSGTATAVGVLWKMDGVSCWVPEISRCHVKLSGVGACDLF